MYKIRRCFYCSFYFYFISTILLTIWHYMIQKFRNFTSLLQNANKLNTHIRYSGLMMKLRSLLNFWNLHWSFAVGFFWLICIWYEMDSLLQSILMSLRKFSRSLKWKITSSSLWILWLTISYGNLLRFWKWN